VKAGRGCVLTDPFAPRPKWQTWSAFCVLVIAFVCSVMFSSDSDRFQGYAALCSLMLASALLFASWVDLDRFILPDVLTLPLVVIGLAVTLYLEGPIALHMIGAVLGYTIIWGLGRFWVLRFGREGIGLGDAKLLAAGGAWVGALGLPIILLVASGLGLIIALAFGRSRYPHTEFQLPFGPLLSLGIWVAWCVPLVSF